MTALLARPDTARAVVYCRISRDRAGSRLGVERQAAECRDLAAQHGLDVVLVTDDNDMSGYKRTRPRPGFDHVMSLIQSGEVDVLVAWHVDRLTRRLVEMADLIALCQRHGVRILTVSGGAFDPNESGAVLQYQIAGAVAEYESRTKSQRITSKHAQIREAGMAHGGIRMFGYEHDRTVRESEATYVRQVAARIVNGESLRSCAAWLAAEGVPTVRGGEWTGPNLRTFLLRPALAGHMVHQGVIVGRASWEPVLDPAVWEAVKGLLSNPERRTASSNTRRHLLTGLAVCGACGAPMKMKASGTTRKTPPPVAYACRATACGKAYRRMDAVDAQVVAWVKARLSRVDMRGLLADASDSADLAALAAERDAVDSRAAALATAFATGAMALEAYNAATQALTAETTRLDAALDSLRSRLAAPERALEGLVGPDPAQAWDDLPLSRQRAVIDVLATVTIQPGRTGNAYDPSLTVITPRTR